MDKLEKPHELPAMAFEDIPTPEEHAQEVRKIFTVCITTAVSVVILAILSIVIALARGVPLQTLALVVPIVMAIAIVTFGIGYGIPVGLVSLKRLEIAYRMGYFGIGQSRDVATSMKTIADRIQKETKPLPTGRRPSVEVGSGPS
jgi:hypothetical protein